jgi:hypothetical protein
MKSFAKGLASPPPSVPEQPPAPSKMPAVRRMVFGAYVMFAPARWTLYPLRVAVPLKRLMKRRQRAVGA